MSTWHALLIVDTVTLALCAAFLDDALSRLHRLENDA